MKMAIDHDKHSNKHDIKSYQEKKELKPALNSRLQFHQHYFFSKKEKRCQVEGPNSPPSTTMLLTSLF